MADVGEMAPEDEAYVLEPVEGEEEPQSEASQAEIIAQIMQMDNIAPSLDDQKLAEIARRVIDEYKLDDESRKPWLDRSKAGLDLAMMISEGKKTYPIESGSSNVKYPLIASAALQFNARAYPAIVPGDRIVKAKLWGSDPNGVKAARGERVAEYQSYQLLQEQPEWDADTDRLMITLPITGAAFRKIYYDPAIGHNTSRLVTADRFVVNYRVKDLESAPRITEEMTLYPFEIQERIRDGRFLEFKYGDDKGEFPRDSSDEKTERASDEDEDGPHAFIEQHRLLDLDEDGYPEPYVVVVHLATEKICRIAPNFGPKQVKFSPDGKLLSIRKRDYYVDYTFFPSFDGGFYGIGFGWLLKDINAAINSTINLIVDGAHLATIQGGLISASLGIREKTFRIKNGEWKTVATAGNLAQSVVPITYPGPSATLFELLGLMVEAGKELAAIKDVLTGDQGQAKQSGVAIQALIEQGLQVFTAIYKRTHRSLGKEFAIYRRLNYEFLDAGKYQEFWDGLRVDPKADFRDEDLDISPVSDPAAVTKMQQLAKADYVASLYRDEAFRPLMSGEETLKRALEAAAIAEPEKLIKPEQQPDPKVVALMERQAEAEVEAKEGEAAKNLASAVESISRAEASDVNRDVAQDAMLLKVIQAEGAMEHQEAQQNAAALAAQQGGLPGMGGVQADQAGAGAPAPVGGGGPGAGGTGPVPQQHPDPAGMGAEAVGGSIRERPL